MSVTFFKNCHVSVLGRINIQQLAVLGEGIRLPCLQFPAEPRLVTHTCA